MGQIDGYKVAVTASNGASLLGLAGAAARRIVREGARVTLVCPDAGAAKKLVATSATACTSSSRRCMDLARR